MKNLFAYIAISATVALSLFGLLVALNTRNEEDWQVLGESLIVKCCLGVAFVTAGILTKNICKELKA